ncbi:MAG: aromatic ring-hydroxylating dioxygenase subunit alpha [Novosphingobium sp.]|nr:aromatic ring-hydroxylating dioxygenase subunit alpha [Novosphingobium sp.]
MFADFANHWIIVGLAADLRAGKMQPLTVAGERLVLFRDSEARPAALIDRCPHRGVALSLGTLEGGIVECPFHGWKFDGTGANCLVPWNPDAKRDQLAATALPVREAGGLIWLYTGFAPTTEPAPSETLFKPGVVLSAQSALWNIHWTRAMENMLDSPHLPFVHKGTIGRFVAKYRHGRMETEWFEEPYGARIENIIEGKDKPSRLDYRYPNAMELFLEIPGRLMHLMAICTPENQDQTRLTIVTLRDFARSKLLDPFFRRSNRRIALEDQAILESSLPAEVPPAGQEKSVRTDRPTLAFRKLYFERIKGSSASR